MNDRLERATVVTLIRRDVPQHRRMPWPVTCGGVDDCRRGMIAMLNDELRRLIERRLRSEGSECWVDRSAVHASQEGCAMLQRAGAPRVFVGQCCCRRRDCCRGRRNRLFVAIGPVARSAVTRGTAQLAIFTRPRSTLHCRS